MEPIPDPDESIADVVCHLLSYLYRYMPFEGTWDWLILLILLGVAVHVLSLPLRWRLVESDLTMLNGEALGHRYPAQNLLAWVWELPCLFLLIWLFSTPAGGKLLAGRQPVNPMSFSAVLYWVVLSLAALVVAVLGRFCRGHDTEIQTDASGILESTPHAERSTRALFTGGGVYCVIHRDGHGSIVGAAGVSAACVQAVGTLVCLLCFWHWSVTALSLMLVFLVLSLVADGVRMLCLYVAGSKEENVCRESAAASSGAGATGNLFDKLTSPESRFGQATSHVCHGLGKFISSICSTIVGQRTAQTLMIVGVVVMGRYVSTSDLPIVLAGYLDSIQKESVSSPVSREDKACELLERAKIQTSLTLTGHQVRRLFEEFEETKAAEEALSFVDRIAEDVEAEALSAIRRGKHYGGWGGMAWSGRQEDAEDVSVGTIDAARALLEAIKLADAGRHGEAYRAAKAMLDRHYLSPLVGMASSRGSAWAAKLGGRIENAERHASELCHAAAAAAQRRDHKRAFGYWEVLEKELQDTVAARAHKRVRLDMAQKLLSTAHREASDGNYSDACDIVWTLLKFYPDTEVAHVGLSRGSEWRRRQNDSDGYREREAHSLHERAVAMMRKGDRAGSREQMGQVAARFSDTFTAEMGRRSPMNSWIRMVYADPSVGTGEDAARTNNVALVDHRPMSDPGEAASLARSREKTKEAKRLYDLCHVLARLGDTELALANSKRLKNLYPGTSWARSIVRYEARWGRDQGHNIETMRFSWLASEMKEGIERAIAKGLVVQSNPLDDKCIELLEGFSDATYACAQGRTWKGQYEQSVSASKGELRYSELQRSISKGAEFLMFRPCRSEEPCSTCDGTGYEKYGSGPRIILRCRECRGRGHTGRRREPCRRCDGEKTSRCRVCDGRGYIRSRNVKKMCGNSSCNNGQARCEDCFGRGWAEEEDECRACDGEGNLKRHRCEKCDGEGRRTIIRPYRVVN